MRLQIPDLAKDDLIEGFRFYEAREAGLGNYFLVNLYSDIESLKVFGGIHRKVYRGFHRALSKRFPFAIFYTVEADVVESELCGLPETTVMDSGTLEERLSQRRQGSPIQSRSESNAPAPIQTSTATDARNTVASAVCAPWHFSPSSSELEFNCCWTDRPTRTQLLE